MVTAIPPISGFMNLMPIAPISFGGAGPAAAIPAAALVPDMGTLVTLAGTATAPLTYTASGTFRTTLHITPLGTPGTPGIPPPGTTPPPGSPFIQRVRLELDVDLDLLIVRDRATAGSPLSALPDGTFQTLADAMSTDLLLSSLGASSGTTGNLAALMFGRLLGNGLTSPLDGTTGNASLIDPIAASASLTPQTTRVTATSTTRLDMTVTTALPVAGPTAAPPPATTPVAGAAGVGGTAALPATVVTAPAPAATGPITAATPAPAAGTVTLAAPPAAAAATDTSLQRFLTDAAARAFDTVATNPSYAAAAASLYATVAVFRNQSSEMTPPPAATRDDAVRALTPAASVQPLPTAIA